MCHQTNKINQRNRENQRYGRAWRSQGSQRRYRNADLLACYPRAPKVQQASLDDRDTNDIFSVFHAMSRHPIAESPKTAFQQGSGDAEDAVSHAGSFITESLYLSCLYTVFTTMPAQVLGTLDRRSTSGAQVALRQFHATYTGDMTRHALRLRPSWFILWRDCDRFHGDRWNPALEIP